MKVITIYSEGDMNIFTKFHGYPSSKSSGSISLKTTHTSTSWWKEEKSEDHKWKFSAREILPATPSTSQLYSIGLVFLHKAFLSKTLKCDTVVLCSLINSVGICFCTGQ